MQKLALLLFAAPAAALAYYGFETSIKVNGKAVPGTVLMVDGKSYVPVSALKAGGASVSVNGGVMSIDFAAGGANQQAGVEGKVGEWLFNGIWRFRVNTLTKQTDPAGWKADVEIRDGTTVNGYAPGGTGWQGITLVLDDGTSVPARSDAPELRDTGLNQGAGNPQTIYFDTDSASEPDRIILRFDPKGTEGTPLKFSTTDPSFRVHVK